MRTLRISFVVDGKNVLRTAILTNDLSELSKSKKNQCDYILDDSVLEGFWCLVFNESDTLQYEVEFKYDTDAYLKSIEPVKCIVWESDVIADVVKFNIEEI